MRVNLPTIVHYQGQHDKNIFIQRNDFSCGAASIATLLSYYFDDYTSEEDVLEKAKLLLTENEYGLVKEQGLSMLELESVASELGYDSASVILTPDSLEEVKSPIIVFIELEDYKHFAVLKGVHNGFAYLADPSRGNIEITMDVFLKSWKGHSFFMGKSSFTPAKKHGLTIDKGRPAHMVNTVVESELFKSAPSTFSAKQNIRLQK